MGGSEAYTFGNHLAAMMLGKRRKRTKNLIVWKLFLITFLSMEFFSLTVSVEAPNKR